MSLLYLISGIGPNLNNFVQGKVNSSLPMGVGLLGEPSSPDNCIIWGPLLVGYLTALLILIDIIT